MAFQFVWVQKLIIKYDKERAYPEISLREQQYQLQASPCYQDINTVCC